MTIWACHCLLAWRPLWLYCGGVWAKTQKNEANSSQTDGTVWRWVDGEAEQRLH